MFRTDSSFPKYPIACLFRLSPLSQFLIKKYPRKGDIGFLTNYWLSYLFATNVLKDTEFIDKIRSITISPKEYYKMPSPSISSCFNEWLEMYKKDRIFKSTFVMDSIPGVSEPISIEIDPIPEDAVIAFTGILDKIKTDGMISQEDIEKEIENGSDIF